MFRKRKTLSLLVTVIMTAALVCGCGSDTDQDADKGGGTYTESGYEYRAEVEDDAFVIQAVQDGEVIEHRSEPEAETIEEENCWELIDSGEWRECEMYFPIDIQKDVTVQVLNPDGEDTVMAELAYTPQ